MTEHQVGTGQGTRSGTVARVARWSPRLAVVLALWGTAHLIAWGNRWYVTEMLARSAGTDQAGWEFRYDLLHAAHEALVSGVGLLLLAAALLWLARRSRRALEARG